MAVFLQEILSLQLITGSPDSGGRNTFLQRISSNRNQNPKLYMNKEDVRFQTMAFLLISRVIECDEGVF